MALTKCSECGGEISDLAITCPHCGAPTGRGSLYGYGYEYRSPIVIGNLPLVHVATGMDPRTGRKRVAKGIIAIGDIALGVVAVGGVAVGGLALGGCALGVCAIGGLAIGLGFALGGLAVGYVAIGGAAFGVWALGGGAFGVHAFGGNVRGGPALAPRPEHLPSWWR
jgi:hypothetical protein